MGSDARTARCHSCSQRLSNIDYREAILPSTPNSPIPSACRRVTSGSRPQPPFPGPLLQPAEASCVLQLPKVACPKRELDRAATGWPPRCVAVLLPPSACRRFESDARWRLHEARCDAQRSKPSACRRSVASTPSTRAVWRVRLAGTHRRARVTFGMPKVDFVTELMRMQTFGTSLRVGGSSSLSACRSSRYLRRAERSPQRHHSLRSARSRRRVCGPARETSHSEAADSSSVVARPTFSSPKLIARLEKARPGGTRAHPSARRRPSRQLSFACVTLLACSTSACAWSSIRHTARTSASPPLAHTRSAPRIVIAKLPGTHRAGEADTAARSRSTGHPPLPSGAPVRPPEDLHRPRPLRHRRSTSTGRRMVTEPIPAARSSRAGGTGCSLCVKLPCACSGSACVAITIATLAATTRTRTNSSLTTSPLRRPDPRRPAMLIRTAAPPPPHPAASPADTQTRRGSACARRDSRSAEP